MKKKTHAQVLTEAHIKSWGFWLAIIGIGGCAYFINLRIEKKELLVKRSQILEKKLASYEYNSKQINKLSEYQGKIEEALFDIDEKLFYPNLKTQNLQQIYSFSDELEQQIDSLNFNNNLANPGITELSFSISGVTEDLFYLIQNFRERNWYNEVKSIEVLNRNESNQTINLKFDLLNTVE